MRTRIGLDVGGTKMRGVALDEAGQVTATRTVGTPGGRDAVLAVATSVVEELHVHAGADPLTRVGVGIPGLVDAATGTVHHAVNLGLDGRPLELADELRRRLGLPVVVDNDVNAAALGATTLLPGPAPDLAYLSIGTGLAVGLVLDGRLRRGSRAAAGELGHLSLDVAGARCACGQRGCLETLASGTALARAWPVPPGRSAAQEVFAAEGEGDARAAEVVARWAHALATTIRVLVLTVDPEHVLLGGGVAEVGEPLRAAVATALDEQTAETPLLAALHLAKRVEVVPADVPVAAVGAALLTRTEDEWTS